MTDPLIAPPRYQARAALLAQWLVVITIFTLPLSTTLCDIFFIASVIVTLFAGQLRQRLKLLLVHPISLVLLAYFCLCLIGTTYSIAPLRDSLTALSKAATLLIGAFLMTSIVQARFRHYAINAFLMAMVLTLVLGYFKFFFRETFTEYFRFSQHFGWDAVFKDHIIQNFLMAMAAFMFIYRSLQRKKISILYGVLALAATYNVLFMSTGRSGYFIYAVLLAYLFFQRFRVKGLVYAMFLMVFLVEIALICSINFSERIYTAVNDIKQYSTTNRNTSLGIRIESYRKAIILIGQRPLFGFGTGSFSTAATKFIQEKTTNEPIVLSYNNYLNIGVELGLVGMGLTLFMFYIQWQLSGLLKDELKFFLQITILSIAFGCLINPWLSDTTELHFYALFLAVGFSVLNERFARLG